MKKKMNIKILGIFLFLGILLTSTYMEKIHAQVYNDRFYNGDYIYGTYFKKWKNGLGYYETARFLQRSDGQFAYCLQPFVSFVNGKLQTAYDSDYAAITHMTQEQWRRIELLSYYGYQYQNHTDSKWYVITQFMIWKTVDPTSDMYFTDSLDGNRIALYENEMTELEQLISAHTMLPKFQSANYTISLNETITLYDTNSVLSQFNIISDELVHANKNGNTLSITGKQLGETSISLTKSDTKYGRAPIVYVDSEGQDLLVVGSYAPIVHTISVNVVGGKIRIIKVDSETNSTTPLGQGTLIGAVYDVYNSNNTIVSSLTIGEDSTAITDFLPYGTYTIRERKASTGYLLDNTVYTVDVDSEETVEIIVKENSIKGKIKINKVDSETNMCKSQGNATLVGAKYGIYDWNNTLVDTVTIGNDCTATSKDLPYGNYQVREIQPSTGYLIDSKSYDVNIPSNTTIMVTSKENVVKGKIKINKVDSETNMCKSQGHATLVGAKYGIYNSKNELVETLTIGNDCSATSKNLPYGNYEVRELSASVGYQLDSNHYPVKIKNSQTVIITSKENVIKGKIKVMKVDSETNTCKAQGQASLIGAKYGIYNSKNELVETLTIGNDCTATSQFLPYGNYEVRELSASTGYYLNNQVYLQAVLENITYSVIVKEPIIKNEFQFYKFYGNVDTGIIHTEANAQFQILNHKKEVVTTIKTDENGHVTVKLPYGEYTVKQITGMDGYQWISPFTIQVKEQTKLVQNFYLKDGSIMARLKLLKIDSETKMPIPSSHITFRIKDKKTNTYVCQTTDDVICEFKTNDEGILYTPLPLASGDYLIEEVIAPNGYLLATEPVEFSIKDSSKLIEDPIYGPVVELYFENQPVKGIVEIFKYGEQVVMQDNTYIYEQILLSDVKFGLYDVSGNLIEEYVTDENGYLKIDNLSLGTYMLKELESTRNHLINDQEYSFTLEYKDPYTPVILKTFTFENVLPKGELHFTKVDAQTGERIPNTEIKIYTENDVCIYHGFTDKNGKIHLENLFTGKFYITEIKSVEGYQLKEDKLYFNVIENEQLIQIEMKNEKIKGDLEFMKVEKNTNKPLSDTTIEIYTENGNLVRSGVTDENGEIRFNGLEYGKYYIVEREAKEGYTIYEGRIDFEIKEENEVVKLIMEDNKVKGALEFLKVEEDTNKPLMGATVEIYTEDGKLVGSGTTDLEGKILFKGLEYGKYYIVEREAPVGYTNFEGKITFEIRENGGVVTVRMEDNKVKGALEFLKVEEGTNKPLMGATVEIYTEAGKLVGSGTTDLEGKILFEGLEYGKYYVIEKKAPDGYIKFEGKIDFEIKEDGETVTVLMESSEIIEVPNTATTHYNKSSYISILFLMLGFISLTYGKTL